jgi:cardiolipin synthase A/B
MSAVYVGVPVLQDLRRFHFDRGRRWNAVEHLVLQGLAKKARTAGQLVEESDLPRRVVLEVLIRLMRAGWVELQADSRQVTFHATNRGTAVATEDELPWVTERIARRMGFAIDLITGSVFRRRDLTSLWRDEWGKRTHGQRAVAIARPEILPDDLGHISTLLGVLFNENEQLVRVDLSDHPPVERLALFVVREGRPEGLPPHAPAAFNRVLTDAASQAPLVEQPSIQVQVATKPAHAARPERQANFRRDELILGGAAHEEHITGLLRKARRHVLIHSTFLDQTKFERLLPAFRTAASHGCRVDILWGQASVEGGIVKSLQEAESIRKRLEETGLAGLIEVHRFSTRSHAKVLIADDGEGKTTGTVGSCNWLMSGFESFEAIRLRDPHVVGDLLYEVAEMARPQDGQLPELTARLAQSARELHGRQPLSGGARVQILVGAEHDDPVLDARDHAAEQIIVLSHRLGVTAKPAIVIPAAAAARHRNVKVELYYGRPSGPVQQRNVASASWTFREQGVELIAVHRPRLHAKLLLWDDDNAVVTSLNWLSADTSAGNPRSEIGVSVKSPRVAAFLREEFQHSRDLAF